MKALKIQPDGSIKLPLKPSRIAERAPEEELPLEEIAAEVHRMRREKQKRRG